MLSTIWGGDCSAKVEINRPPIFRRFRGNVVVRIIGDRAGFINSTPFENALIELVIFKN